AAQLDVVGAFVQSPFAGFAGEGAVSGQRLLLGTRGEDLSYGLGQFCVAEFGVLSPGGGEVIGRTLELARGLLRRRAGSIEQSREDSHCRPSSCVRRCRV